MGIVKKLLLDSEYKTNYMINIIFYVNGLFNDINGAKKIIYGIFNWVKKRYLSLQRIQANNIC